MTRPHPILITQFACYYRRWFTPAA